MSMGSGPRDGDVGAVLLAESQHGVRNTLATTRMVARRSAEFSESLEDYSAHLDGRLAALARMHNLMIQNATAGIDLGQLVTDELASVRAYRDERTRAEGPDVRLHLRAAEPLVLALALHELTTNAIKFGALASLSGRLAVTWRIDERDGGSQLRLDWVESGVPLDAQAPRRNGFGTVVLLEMVAQDLQARGSLAFASGGLHYGMVMPLTARVRHAA